MFQLMVSGNSYDTILDPTRRYPGKSLRQRSINGGDKEEKVGSWEGG